MDIYNYTCSICDKKKEKSFLPNETIERIIKCDCGSDMIRDWSTPPSLVFKGAGYTPKFHAYDKKYGFKGG